MGIILGKLKTIVPIVTTLITIMWLPPAPGWGTVASKIKAKQYDQAGQSFIAGMTGLRLGPIGGQSKTEIDVFGTFNPIDFDNAPYTKTGMWARIALEGIGAVQGFVRDLFKGLK